MEKNSDDKVGIDDACAVTAGEVAGSPMAFCVEYVDDAGRLESSVVAVSACEASDVADILQQIDGGEAMSLRTTVAEKNFASECFQNTGCEERKDGAGG